MRSNNGTMRTKAPEKIVVVFSNVLHDSEMQVRAAVRSLPTELSPIPQWALESNSDCVESQWITTTAPGLARELSVALASKRSVTLDSDMLTGWWRLAQCITKYDTLIGEGNQYFVCTSGDVPCEVRCRFDGTVLRAVRQVFGVYARLTVRSGNQEETLDRAFVRLTTEESYELPPLSAEVVYAAARQLSFDYLYNADLPGPVYRHGPGVVAERSLSQHFWKKDECAKASDPILDVLDPRPFRDLADTNEWFLPLGACETAHASKLACVPKDYRGPRVIAAEPCLHQYVQQSLKDTLYRWLNRSPLRHAIALTRQDLNALAALKGSKTGEVDTIDLSDASDYVRWSHVKTMWRLRPDLLDAFSLVRTRWIQHSGKIAELTTAFPMGSPLCFPMQSVVYAALLIADQLSSIGVRSTPTARNITQAIDALQLRVYGDDIIVSHEYATRAIATLTRAGFRPNVSKCCLGPYFKESCGTDAWRGVNVTPLRPRNLPGSEECSVNTLIADAQNFADRGYFRTALALLKYARSASRHRIVVVPDGQRQAGVIVCKFLYDLYGDECQTASFNRSLQVWQAPIYSESLLMDRKGIPETVRYRAALRSGRSPEGWVFMGAKTILRKHLAFFYYPPRVLRV